MFPIFLAILVRYKCLICTIKILKFWTPDIIVHIIVQKMMQSRFIGQYCFLWMFMKWQTAQTLIRLLQMEQSDQGLHCLLRHICPNIYIFYSITIKVRPLVKINHLYHQIVNYKKCTVAVTIHKQTGDFDNIWPRHS